MTAEASEASFQQKLTLKPQERWFSTRRVWGIVRHSKGKVTENHQEDWSRQNKVGERFVEPSSSTAVDAYGNRRRLRRQATDRHLICINTLASGLDGKEQHGDRLRNSTRTVRRLRSCDSFSRIIRSLAKLAFSDIKSLFQKRTSQYDVYCILVKEFVDIKIYKIVEK